MSSRTGGLDSAAAVLFCDYYQASAAAGNHAGGVNALRADGSAIFLPVPATFDIDAGSADDDTGLLTAFNLLDGL